MRKKVKNLSPDAPLYHADHPRPTTRRDFIRQGFMAGLGMITGPSLFGLFANPREARAALSSDLQALKSSCGIDTLGGGKIPFICFDLAGGANIAGSNVLTGRQGGQYDFLTTAGYNRLGLPGDMLPSILNPATGVSDFINTELGLGFHSDSAFLRGILEKVSPGNRANINGAVIPARSENDTANNPHNPMYAINRCGADGELLTLIGSRSSDSGGNSMAPADQIDPSVRPTKVDRPSDTTGLVDTGKLVGLFEQSDAVAVMEAIQRISDMKLDRVNTGISSDAVVKELVRCGYVKSADLVDRYGDPAALDVTADADIIGPIFSQAEFDGDGEFRKTASVMKLVVNGYAGAGTITMGGYDYHTGDRAVGEIRDLRAGRCMGACIEYAARLGMPLMLYVFSDGSVSSNGAVDNSADGRGKGVWTGDNQSTAASFFLVYNPSGPATLTGGSLDEQLRHQQIGYFTADGAVDNGSSPAANNVNQLVLTVALNYLALHGEQGQFSSLFGSSLGNAAMLDSLTAFSPIM
ncbi:MAG: hypothetical protein ABW076_06840 [Candidatus Thiodiazotropha sp.]